MGILAGGGLRAQCTNLILNQGVADVIDEAAEFLSVLDVLEETLDRALFCQWLEDSGDVFQFPGDPWLSDSIENMG